MKNQHEEDEFAGAQSRSAQGVTWNPKDETKGHEKSLIGWITKISHEVGQYNSDVYQIEDKNGELWSVWADTVLASEQGLGGLPVGAYVKIDFLGPKLKKNAPQGSKKSTDYFNNWAVTPLPSKYRKPGFDGGATVAHNEAPVGAKTQAVSVPDHGSVAAPEDSLPF